MHASRLWQDNRIPGENPYAQGDILVHRKALAWYTVYLYIRVGVFIFFYLFSSIFFFFFILPSYLSLSTIKKEMKVTVR